MLTQFQLKSLTFSDGTTIETTDAKIIALVGPNNSGKSSTLREIMSAAADSENIGPVLKAVEFEKRGSSSDLKQWLDQNVQKVKLRYEREDHYVWLGRGCSVNDVDSNWNHKNSDSLSGILCTLIDVEKRIEVANPQEPIDFFSEAPSHPVHVLFKNPTLEQKVNETFKAAFKKELVLNRGGGKVIAFHIGTKPELNPGEDNLSPSYFQRLRKLPFLHNQGHGMRSFVGCILHAFTTPAFVHLLDEPEAFLHPPHAKLLGNLLGRSIAPNRQIVTATHSGDFLRGLLDANLGSLCVIRLTCDGRVNHVHELNSESIRVLWADPVLRFSNVLDAIFHDGVVLCESDSDCRFYSAVLNAVLENRGEIAPDVMFTASGGKDRMPVIIQSLRRLGVKIRVIADFDVLRDESTLSGIISALGGDWKSIRPAWQNLNTNIRTQTPPLGLNQVRDQINSALEEEKTASLSENAIEKIKRALKATSPWHHVKLAGVGAVASGQPRVQLNDLLVYLEKCGLHIVKCGEIERFVPSVGMHGPKWVAQVLAKNLATDLELEPARQFISEVFDVGPHSGWCQPQQQPPIAPEVLPESISNNNSRPIPTRSFWSVLLKKLGVKNYDV